MTQPDAADPLLDRIDRLTRVVEVALAPRLEAARDAVREDPIDAAIVSAAAGGWTPAKDLIAEVEARSGRRKSLIHDHIGGLLDRGFLEKQGGGPKTEYRANPVVAA